MLAPLSWLKEYVDITLNPKQLGERLTEVGLGCEKITEKDGDIIFDLEITPNRPDWLSIIGVAREIAAIENKPVKYPSLRLDVNKKPQHVLPLDIHVDLAISPRHTGIIIDGVTVKESPKWLQEKLIKIGQRPINNIVDITNYVMFELGNPLHAFDYDRIQGHRMEITQAIGGEAFKSVDGLSYRLPKNAVIVKDAENIIDLCGIKGGYNSGTFEDTKTLFLWAPVENPALIRKASQALGLRSEASSIFERGVNAGGTIDAVRRAADLILEHAGGSIASGLYDLKKEEYKPWKLSLRLERLEFILGIKIPDKQVLELLERLHLNPTIVPNVDSGQARMTERKIVECTIPTYRNDLQIEEDVIEEVARLYGYNNFPKTLPVGEIPTQMIPYFKNYRLDEKVKNILIASGFSEIYTYSLLSEQDLTAIDIDPDQTLRIDNPVSREYEYLRPTLKSNLEKALKQNKAFAKEVSLFELGKVYTGKSLAAHKEYYVLSGITNTKNFSEVKGILERIYRDIGIEENPGEYMHVLPNGVFFELPYSELLTKMQPLKVFMPLPKYPPIIEDIALITPEDVQTGNIIKEIKKQSPLIAEVSLHDQYENTRTFHIIYLDREKNLTNEEVGEIRKKILQSLEKKFHVSQK